MKKYILSTLSFLSLAVATQAATIAVGAGFGATSGIIPQTSGGALLTGGGYYIGVGVFDTVPVITDQISLIKAVAVDFQEFGNATAATTGATAGKITASITAIPSNPATFNTKELYILIGNSATRALSTEFSILRGTPATWAFPADTAAGGATTLTVSSIASFSLVPGAGEEIDAATDSIRLAPIPEPSTTLMFASLGAMALFRRRK